MPTTSPLSLARAHALAKLGGLSCGKVRAAVIVPAYAEPGLPSPDTWSATRERYGAVDVLRIAVPGVCPSIVRAGCVSALAALGIDTLLLLGEG